MTKKLNRGLLLSFVIDVIYSPFCVVAIANPPLCSITKRAPKNKSDNTYGPCRKSVFASGKKMDFKVAQYVRQYCYAFPVAMY